MKKHVKTVLFGIYAGLAIGFGGLLNILMNSAFSGNPIWGRILGSLLFPIGLTLVCFLGLNLFTGKIGYVLDNNKGYLGFLVLVYLGNIIGSLLIGVFCLLVFKDTGVYGTAWKISDGKMVNFEFLPMMKLFAGAVLCGVCVYAAVFCYKTFKQVWLKVIGIFIPIFLFVFFKFDHCVANMFYFTFSWHYGNPLAYLNIAIVTLGNSLGSIVINELVKAFKKLFLKNEQKGA